MDKNVQFQNIGKNVEVGLDQESGCILIRIDPSKSLGRSSSGKSVNVATTSGNVKLPLEGLTHLTLGLNFYRPPEEGE